MRVLVTALVFLSFFGGIPALANWLGDPALFVASYYADQNADVRERVGYSEDKLLHHWGKYGLGEGRRSSPVFDVRYYLKANPDVAQAVGAKNYPKAAQHWYNNGRREGRPSHPDFHVREYLRINKNVARTVGAQNYVKAIENYLESGFAKGLRGR